MGVLVYYLYARVAYFTSNIVLFLHLHFCALIIFTIFGDFNLGLVVL